MSGLRSKTTLPNASVALQILRATDSTFDARTDTVAIEEPLEIRLSRFIEGTAQRPEVVAITMRTPGHDDALAAGFLWTEGIIRETAEIHRIEPPRLTLAGRPQNTIDVYLHSSDESVANAPRSFFINSSCGVCGKSSIAALHTARPRFAPPPALEVNAAVVAALPDTLRKSQDVFEETGGLHAAALFSAAVNYCCCAKTSAGTTPWIKLWERCFCKIACPPMTAFSWSAAGPVLNSCKKPRWPEFSSSPPSEPPPRSRSPRRSASASRSSALSAMAALTSTRATSALSTPRTPQPPSAFEAPAASNADEFSFTPDDAGERSTHPRPGPGCPNSQAPAPRPAPTPR